MSGHYARAPRQRQTRPSWLCMDAEVTVAAGGKSWRRAGPIAWPFSNEDRQSVNPVLL
jgi:hypothetical protein